MSLDCTGFGLGQFTGRERGDLLIAQTVRACRLKVALFQFDRHPAHDSQNQQHVPALPAAGDMNALSVRKLRVLRQSLGDRA
jgi:hypothetical protein